MAFSTIPSLKPATAGVRWTPRPVPCARSCRQRRCPASSPRWPRFPRSGNIPTGYSQRSATTRRVSTPCIGKKLCDTWIFPNVGPSGHAWPPGSNGGTALEPAEVLGTKLGHFGRDHDLAIWLPLVALEVLLMVVLGTIEGVERHHFRYDGRIPKVCRVQLLDHRFGDALLFGGVVEDRRAVLRPNVRALPV